MRQAWHEYRVLALADGRLEDELNARGSEGWHVVATIIGSEIVGAGVRLHHVDRDKLTEPVWLGGVLKFVGGYLADPAQAGRGGEHTRPRGRAAGGAGTMRTKSLTVVVGTALLAGCGGGDGVPSDEGGGVRRFSNGVTCASDDSGRGVACARADGVGYGIGISRLAVVVRDAAGQPVFEAAQPEGSGTNVHPEKAREFARGSLITNDVVCLADPDGVACVRTDAWGYVMGIGREYVVVTFDGRSVYEALQPEG